MDKMRLAKAIFLTVGLTLFMTIPAMLVVNPLYLMAVTLMAVGFTVLSNAIYWSLD